MHVWYVDHESERANCLFYLLLQKMVTLIFGFEYLFNKMEALEKFIANLDNQDTSLLECTYHPIFNYLYYYSSYIPFIAT